MKKIIWILAVIFGLCSFSFAQNANHDKAALRDKVEKRVQNYQDRAFTWNNQHNLTWNKINEISEENKMALKKVDTYVQWKLKLVKLVENTANKVKVLATKIWYNTDTVNNLLTQIQQVKYDYKNLSNYIIENKLNKQQINEKIKEYNETMKTVIYSLKAELTNLKEYFKSKWR